MPAWTLPSAPTLRRGVLSLRQDQARPTHPLSRSHPKLFQYCLDSLRGRLRLRTGRRLFDKFVFGVHSWFTFPFSKVYTIKLRNDSVSAGVLQAKGVSHA